MSEIKAEYTLAVKKSVVDFVLGESLIRMKTANAAGPLNGERIELSSIALKYKHK